MSKRKDQTPATETTTEATATAPETKPEETKATEPTAPAKPKTPKRSTEAELKARYPHLVEGTLRWETEGTHANKQTVEAKLTCGHTHRIATSDLWQVRSCPTCRKADKTAARKTARERRRAFFAAQREAAAN